jgi:hypothetical protein
MKPICIHANSVQWQKEYLPRFMAGFKKHGHEVRVSTKDEADPEAVNVVFANNSWTKTVHACKLTGIPLLTVNRCFFGNRFDMVSIGWGGFNGDADFCLDPFMPDTRWKKHGFDIPHWLDRPGYILICGEFRDMSPWYRQLSEELENEEIRFRPHPFTNILPAAWQLAPGKRQDDIETALAGAKACITFDSIAGCDAALAGVPSITYGRKSMAWDVSYHSLAQYYSSSVDLPRQHPWACRLAYCQWSHNEIKNGEFWEHLSPKLSNPSITPRHTTRT